MLTNCTSSVDNIPDCSHHNGSCTSIKTYNGQFTFRHHEGYCIAKRDRKDKHLLLADLGKRLEYLAQKNFCIEKARMVL